jgi:hypothetical protein
MMRVRAGHAVLVFLASVVLGPCSSGRLYVTQTSHDAAKSAVEGAADQSTKSLTIIAKQLNDFEAGELKDAIHKIADEHYVGRWLSNFLTRRGL